MQHKPYPRGALFIKGYSITQIVPYIPDDACNRATSPMGRSCVVVVCLLWITQSNK